VKIIAFIFLLPLAFLIFQPAFQSSTGELKKQDCSGMHCHKKDQSGKKKGDCSTNGCNPFMACAYGNFYILNKQAIDHIIQVKETGLIPVINDNRLASALSECWHPPELV
jgi:hypothetical protein